jgi:hypothetical protein
MKLIPKPNKRDIAVIVAVVLGQENFTVYSTCMISHISRRMPNSIATKPRNDKSADILYPPFSHDAWLIRIYEKQLSLDMVELWGLRTLELR